MPDFKKSFKERKAAHEENDEIDRVLESGESQGSYSLIDDIDEMNKALAAIDAEYDVEVEI